ncbi:MAG: permease-like cell division protein FtsX [Bacilli bacterium]
MKVFRILFKNISDAFKSVGRNLSLSIASISCITITLILVALAIILSMNVNNFTQDIEKDMTIVVFIKKEVSSEGIAALKSQIEKLSNIDNITFKSNEQAKNDMKEEDKMFEVITSEWTKETNPLLNSYLVKVKDVESISKTALEIQKFDTVDGVKYGEGMVEELVDIFGAIKNVTIVIVVALVLVTAFLISNTIKITITSRKRQIEIMRLVGASNSYIKLPFFFEGIIIGFLGSIIPIFASCYGYAYLYSKSGGSLFLPILRLVTPDKIMILVVVSTVTIGVVVGAIGSYRAVRRFLKI